MSRGKKILSFDVSTPQGFFLKLKQEQESLEANLTSSRYAINAAMTAWHLIEWVWALSVDANPEVKKQIGKHSKDLTTFRTFLIDQCPQMETMRCICGGSKHLGVDGNSLKSTSVYGGSFNRSFGKGFDVARLEVEKNDGSLVYFDNELEAVVDFWERFFNTHLV